VKKIVSSILVLAIIFSMPIFARADTITGKFINVYSTTQRVMTVNTIQQDGYTLFYVNDIGKMLGLTVEEQSDGTYKLSKGILSVIIDLKNREWFYNLTENTAKMRASIELSTQNGNLFIHPFPIFDAFGAGYYVSNDTLHVSMPEYSIWNDFPILSNTFEIDMQQIYGSFGKNVALTCDLLMEIFNGKIELYDQKNDTTSTLFRRALIEPSTVNPYNDYTKELAQGTDAYLQNLIGVFDNGLIDASKNSISNTKDMSKAIKDLAEYKLDFNLKNNTSIPDLAEQVGFINQINDYTSNLDKLTYMLKFIQDANTLEQIGQGSSDMLKAYVDVYNENAGNFPNCDMNIKDVKQLNNEVKNSWSAALAAGSSTLKDFLIQQMQGKAKGLIFEGTYYGFALEAATFITSNVILPDLVKSYSADLTAFYQADIQNYVCNLLSKAIIKAKNESFSNQETMNQVKSLLLLYLRTTICANNNLIASLKEFDPSSNWITTLNSRNETLYDYLYITTNADYSALKIPGNSSSCKYNDALLSPTPSLSTEASQPPKDTAQTPTTAQQPEPVTTKQPSSPESTLPPADKTNIAKAIVGVWSSSNGQLSFTKDGKVADGLNGIWGPSTYEIDGDTITINSALLGPEIYTVRMSGNTMYFLYDNGEVRLKFTKVELSSAEQQSSPNSTLPPADKKNIAKAIVGVWSSHNGQLSFTKDGNIVDGLDGIWGPSTYEINGNIITINSLLLGTEIYTVRMSGNTMYFLYNDGGVYVTFTKVK